MDQKKLCFVQLLSLSFFLVTEETVVNTIGEDPGLTPLCSDAKLNAVTMIVCKIKTKNMTPGEGCRLLYHYEKGFKDECDSRFSLKTVNQTVFLQLTHLTREDEGNYTCECSHRHGTETVQGTTEDGRNSPLSNLSLTTMSSSAAAFITITGVLLGFLLRKTHCRCHSQSRELEVSVSQEKQENLYATLQQPANDLYQTVSLRVLQHLYSESTAPGAPSGRDEVYEEV